MPQAVKKTISASVLMIHYNRFADNYGSGYPEVLNPPALLDGISSAVKAIGDGEIPQTTMLYILEDEHDVKNPLSARYLLMINHHPGDAASSENYAIRLFYTGTNELESVSTVDESEVVWSPDTLENSQHKNRTKYYLGFVYLLCDKSPGFDEIPVAENELTVEDLIALGVEGELPAELIEISIDEDGEANIESVEQVQAVIKDTQDNIVSAEFDEMAEDLFGEGIQEPTQSAQPAEPEPVPEQDDTEVIIYTPEEYEESYDDLAMDYEELFDEDMFN